MITNLLFCSFCTFIFFTDRDVVCLAKNIYFEARAETLQGQFYVGYVTLNRVFDTRWPDNICGVIYQNKQFSWFWDGKSDIPQEEESYNTSKLVAEALLYSKYYIDITDNSLYYHSIYIKPYWDFNKLKITQTINNHVFYTDK